MNRAQRQAVLGVRFDQVTTRVIDDIPVAVSSEFSSMKAGSNVCVK